MITEAYQKMRMEQMLAFQGGNPAGAELFRTIRTAEANLAVLQDATSSVQEVRAARESLANLMPNLIVGYDSEGRAILAGNEQLRERLSLMREGRKNITARRQWTTARSTQTTPAPCKNRSRTLRPAWRRTGNGWNGATQR